MRRITGIAIAATLAGPAMAADLPLAAPPAPPVYNWTGLYFGVNGGGAWGQQDPFNIITNRFDHLAISYSGGEVGGTASAQIQIAHVVLGTEVDLDWAGVRGSSILTPTIFGNPLGLTFNATTNINWELTARARVGYAWENILFYATGGLAVLGAKTTLSTLGGLTCGTFGIIGGRSLPNIVIPIGAASGRTILDCCPRAHSSTGTVKSTKTRSKSASITSSTCGLRRRSSRNIKPSIAVWTRRKQNPAARPGF